MTEADWRAMLAEQQRGNALLAEILQVVEGQRSFEVAVLHALAEGTRDAEGVSNMVGGQYGALVRTRRALEGARWRLGAALASASRGGGTGGWRWWVSPADTAHELRGIANDMRRGLDYCSIETAASRLDLVADGLDPRVEGKTDDCGT